LLFFFLHSYSQSVEIPVIDYVTVNQTSLKPEIYWSVQDPSSLNGYAVKRFIRSYPSVPDNTWHTVDVIHDSSVFTYEDISSTYGSARPDLYPEMYEITAFRTDGTDTVYSLPSIVHQTVFISASYEYCDNEIILKWTNYKGWGYKFSHYELYGKENNGEFKKLTETLFGDTVFAYTSVSYNSDYFFYVKAVRDDGTVSLSNNCNINTQTVNFPSFLNIDSVIVEGNNILSLYFTPDIYADAVRYSLYKSNKTDEGFQIAGYVDAESGSFNIKDDYFDADKLTFYYIAAEDYCGNNIFISDTVSNIVLRAQADNTSKKINVVWSDLYAGTYRIFRSCDNKPFEEINETTSRNYIDDITDIFEEQFSGKTTSGEFCYYTEFYNQEYKSISNTDCAYLEETILMPDAFNPKSLTEENRTFKPKAAFLSDYTLTIYGVYGDIIFETRNPDEGWDGRLKNGKLAPVSTYLYFISYKNAGGKRVKFKNYVTLVY